MTEFHGDDIHKDDLYELQEVSDVPSGISKRKQSWGLLVTEHYGERFGEGSPLQRLVQRIVRGFHDPEHGFGHPADVNSFDDLPEDTPPQAST